MKTALSDAVALCKKHEQSVSKALGRLVRSVRGLALCEKHEQSVSKRAFKALRLKRCMASWARSGLARAPTIMSYPGKRDWPADNRGGGGPGKRRRAVEHEDGEIEEGEMPEAPPPARGGRGNLSTAPVHARTSPAPIGTVQAAASGGVLGAWYHASDVAVAPDSAHAAAWLCAAGHALALLA